MKATRLLVRGIVQGVGYRLFTARVARTLGLNGFVRNLDDGRVEAVVAGPGEIVDPGETPVEWRDRHADRIAEAKEAFPE